MTGSGLHCRQALLPRGRKTAPDDKFLDAAPVQCVTLTAQSGKVTHATLSICTRELNRSPTTPQRLPPQRSGIVRSPNKKQGLLACAPGNTSSRWPEISCICFRIAIACRESGAMCGVRIFAPRPEKRTFSIVSRVAGMVQILCLKSISLQRAKRSSQERINRWSVSTTASLVSCRPC